MHWNHEPPSVWSPGFSRSEPFKPPKGGTLNQRRFMESLLSLLRMHCDHEPTPSPSQEGSESPVPLLGGVRGGLVGARFMERAGVRADVSAHLSSMNQPIRSAKSGLLKLRRSTTLPWLRTPVLA